MERRVASTLPLKRVTPQGVKLKERRSALHPPHSGEGFPDETSGATAPRECASATRISTKLCGLNRARVPQSNAKFHAR
jgi:hypothetical protein